VKTLHSAVYEGVVRHHRKGPRAHLFNYRMAQLYIDLDELDQLFSDRWLWSVNRRNLAQFKRSDYLGPVQMPLAQAVRDRAEAELGVRPVGPIRVLTHLRYAGIIFNPVTFYYCFEADGQTLVCVVAEITNTPWRERHTYVVPAIGAQFAKRFHVSPFIGMDRGYDWRFTVPGDQLHVHMGVSHAGASEFDATLTLQRRALNARSLWRVLWRYPLMTLQVVAAIHWQALRLWLKGTPVHDHPKAPVDAL
jgi:uncharacterized protein